jgi:hypothetical protein
MPQTVARVVITITASYLILLAGGVRWHWSAGPPYERASPGLLLAFAAAAALVALVSIWSAFAAIHWSTRASGLLLGTAVVAGVLSAFLDWNNFFVWQLIVIIYAQLAFLIIAFAAVRLCGYAIDTSQLRFPDLDANENKNVMGWRFTVRDLLMLTVGLAAFFCLLHYSKPAQLTTRLYSMLVIGGLCAALVAFVAYWASFSRMPLAVRTAALALATPSGGIVYVVLEKYERLLMSANWYACVTAVEVLLIAIPLTVVRSAGYRLMKLSPHP